MENGQWRNKLADFKNVRFLHWKALQKVDINSEKIIMYSLEVILNYIYTFAFLSNSDFYSIKKNNWIKFDQEIALKKMRSI